MEMIMLGVTLTVSMVVASVITTLIAWKVMMSPKTWEAMYKQTFKMMTKLNEFDFDSLTEDEES